jgi:3-deoxy-7-phosphoheptulonate synthase
MSDGAQSLFPDQLTALVEKLRRLAPVVNRTIAPAVAQVHA